MSNRTLWGYAVIRVWEVAIARVLIYNRRSIYIYE